MPRSRRVWEALAWLTLSAAGALAGEPLTLDQLVERHVAARGGLGALHAIKTLTFSRRGSKGPEPAMVKMRPYYFMVGCTEAECGYAEGFDGSAWEASTKRQRMIRARGEAAKAIRRAGEFDDPIIGWREKGHTAALRGIEDFQGQAAYRVDMVLNDGLPMTCYFDPRTFLMLGNRRSVPEHARGPHLDTITRWENYRPVAGFLYPFTTVQQDVQTGAIDRGEWATIEANRPYEPSFFTPPPMTPSASTRLALHLLSIAKSIGSAEQWFAAYRGFRADPANASVDTERDLDWLGYEMLKDGEIAKALLAFETDIVEHPASANAYDSLGDGWIQAGRPVDAIDAFGKALQLAPDAKDTARKLGALTRSAR